MLENVPEPSFGYEQEAAPEYFFTPYIWLIVRESSGLIWEPTRIVLLSANDGDDDIVAENSAIDEGLPILMSFAGVDDVDESATARGSAA
eukprot:scaffold65389_cov35-Tisochrysis_lutea.AAC.1